MSGIFSSEISMMAIKISRDFKPNLHFLNLESNSVYTLACARKIYNVFYYTYYCTCRNFLAFKSNCDLNRNIFPLLVPCSELTFSETRSLIGPDMTRDMMGFDNEAESVYSADDGDGMPMSAATRK